MGDFVIERGVLIKYQGKSRDITIPDGVKVIGMEAFRFRGITRIIMPDTVMSIRDNAFLGCQNLVEVKFSRNLQCIFHNAFRNCMSLTRVELFEGLETIGSHAFESCPNLKELILPEYPVQIGEYAFAYCHGLADGEGFVVIQGNLIGYTGGYREEFRVPEGVRNIRFGMNWRGCNPRRVFLPASIEHIDDGVFKDCSRLEECAMAFGIDDPKEAQRLVKRVFSWEILARMYLNGKLRACDLVLETVKKTIGSKAGRQKLLGNLLEDTDSLPMIRFLECVKKFPLEELDQAIEGAKYAGVRTVLLEYKRRHYTPEMVEQAELDAMDKEWGLKEKTLSDWRKELKIVKRDGRYVITGFKEDHAWEAVQSGKAPDGVEVTIPGQIRGISVEIGDWVFRYCPYVQTVIVQEGATAIGDYVFSDCHRLRDVYIPASVTEFGKNENSFYLKYTHTDFTIHAPAGSCAEAYAKEHHIRFVAG